MTKKLYLHLEAEMPEEEGGAPSFSIKTNLDENGIIIWTTRLQHQLLGNQKPLKLKPFKEN